MTATVPPPTAAPPPTAQATPEQIAGTIARLREVDTRIDEIKAQLKELETRRGELSADLRSVLGTGTHPAPTGFGLDGAVVSIAVTRRFNAKRATEVLRNTTYWPQICEQVPRAELAKKVFVDDLAPLLDLCKVESDPNVSLELPKGA